MQLSLVLPMLALGHSTLSSPSVAQQAGLAPPALVRDVPARTEGAAPSGLRNLDTSGGLLAFSGELLFFQVLEATEEVDLNGDGDLSDAVVHAYDPESGTLLNTGFAVDSYLYTGVDPDAYVASGRQFAISVDESDQGETDLNGDGDTRDDVPHVIDFDTGAVINLGVAQPHFGSDYPKTIAGTQMLLGVAEGKNGRTDLNGDGDTVDIVHHRFSFSSGELTNLGLATDRRPAAELVTGEGLVFFRVNEYEQGMTDLNGDGDLADEVGFVVSEEGTPRSLGIAVYAWYGVLGGVAWMLVSESSQGEDLNGDGDLSDYLTFTYDPARRQLRNLNNVPYPLDVDDGGVYSMLVETVGQYPLYRTLPSFYDAAKDRFDTLDLAVGGTEYPTGSYGGPPDTILITEVHFLDVGFADGDVGSTQSADGTVVVFGVLERFQGEDLNGDGLTDGIVLHEYDFETRSATNLGRLTSMNVIPRLSVSGNLAAILITEATQDLNGDGDTLDDVVHLYDASTGSFHNTGFAAYTSVLAPYSLHSLGLEGQHAAFVVDESAQGHDLNGDGDMLDTVPFVYDVIARRARSTELASTDYVRGDDVMAFTVEESAQGEDLNGDGDLVDQFVHVLTLPRSQAGR